MSASGIGRFGTPPSDTLIWYRWGYGGRPFSVINSLLRKIPPSAIPTPPSPLVHAVETTEPRPWQTPRQSPVLAPGECLIARAVHHGSRTAPIHRTITTAFGGRDWRGPDPASASLAGPPPPTFRTGI